MELISYIKNIVRPYVRTNELLDEINEKGLDADFFKIYKALKTEGNINIMPQQVFKYIEDIALKRFNQNNELDKIYAWEMGERPPQPYENGSWQEEYLAEWRE